ncbi:MAG: hypothetical protein ACLP4W_29615 [Mycobacterium sp.]|uniref:hypothetical protein n=1 Tax=Mycobacterium sp. TaxID=1785 RepID=UPI003F99CC2D
MTIRTFSGTHPFHPTVLSDTDADIEGNSDDIISDIEHGICPRCGGPLPTMPEFPAGSRITKCRSIPICGRCGSDEVNEQCMAEAGIGWGLSSAGEWPVPTEHIEERRACWDAHSRPAILTVTDGDLHLLDEDGVARVINPLNTGGWARYGGIDGGGDDAA